MEHRGGTSAHNAIEISTGFADAGWSSSCQARMKSFFMAHGFSGWDEAISGLLFWTYD